MKPSQPINKSPSMDPGLRICNRAWAPPETLTAALSWLICSLQLVLRKIRPSSARREPHRHELTTVTVEQKNLQSIRLGRGDFLVHFYEAEETKYKAIMGPLNLDLPL